MIYRVLSGQVKYGGRYWHEGDTLNMERGHAAPLLAMGVIKAVDEPPAALLATVKAEVPAPTPIPARGHPRKE